ncbi:MAG: 4a-hydroxytetrahydrobiopterin dehydratase [Nitriliruptorales bacterium]|nr:4a-hydroxytetrahydrobiopterin dehydratase [Nitriliruptorales bacterium]
MGGDRRTEQKVRDVTLDQTVLTGQDLEDEGLDDWRILFSTLHARFETGDFATGVKLVDAIAKTAEEMNHHPDVDLTYPRVDVRLTSHDVGGVTKRDVRLARTVSALAEQLGAIPKPGETSVLELALDTPNFAEVKPFWAALLRYAPNDDHDDELNDPDGTMPSIWGQQTDPHETPRQRWHLDLRVPPETVDLRIERALQAGGTLVSDEHAPAFWVLADPQGNKACITTWRGRGIA